MPRMSMAAVGLALWATSALSACNGYPNTVGNVTADVSIKRPYGLQALTGTGAGWKKTDVFTYEATLYKLESGVPVATAPASVLPATASKFTFVGLSRGNVYQVEVVAKGNAGGTASTETLNKRHPAFATLDLTTANASATQELAVTVQLDGEELNPTLPVKPLAPTTEGQWSNPSAAPVLETSTAPSPPPDSEGIPVSYRVEGR